MKSMLFLLLFLFMAIPCAADTIWVNWDGSADYTTIGAAIDAAANGDIILVAQGTYYENISFSGKDIILTSSDTEDLNVVAATVIDGSGLDTVVKFNGTETSDCKLLGFTITNGYGPTNQAAGGIWGAATGPDTNATIADCIIQDNTASKHGGGVRDVAGLIDGCIITGNSAYNNGGGLTDCHGTISNCLIYSNTATNNGGGMVYCDGDIVNCTIVENTAGVSGGGLAWSSGTITNCIFWGNSLGQVSGLWPWPNGYMTYSCIQDWAYGGTGNITTYPDFTNPGGYDYHLSPGSPCIDAGDNNAVPAGIVTDIEQSPRFVDDPNKTDTGSGTAPIVDMGAYEFQALPTIVVWPKALEFAALEDGLNPPDQVLKIRNASPATMDWQISEACSWLEVIPDNGTSAGEIDEVILSVDISGLGWGIYDCNLTISDPCAVNSPQTVEVMLDLTGPIIELSTSQLEFTAFEDGADPNNRILTIRNIGGYALNWEISKNCSWLHVDPCSGSSTGEADEATVSVDISGLNWGIYDCNLTISDPYAMNNPQTVEVTLQVIGPIIETSVSQLNFTAFEYGPNPDDQSFTIRNNGGSVLYWEIIEDCGWLRVDPNFGSSTGQTNETTISIDITGLDWGIYNCNLMISDPYAMNNPRIVNVQLLLNGTLYVPSEFPNIQAGINAARDGDAVVVADGTYTGTGNRDIDFNGKSIILRSENGSDNCIINSGGTPLQPHRGFYFYDNDYSNVVIEGFTIRGGDINDGGGIYCSGCFPAPTIRDCIIRNNTAQQRGGGLYWYNCDGGIIEDCTVSDNQADSGGGIYSESSWPMEIRNCVIIRNTADEHGGGINSYNGNDVDIVNCLIGANFARYGGGLSFAWSDASVVKNCTITENDAIENGGGVDCSDGGYVQIIDSILYDDFAVNGLGWEIAVRVGDEGLPGALAVSYSDVEWWVDGAVVEEGCSLDWGDGNIDSDPLFATGFLGDYYLSHTAAGQISNSPCINLGSDTAANLGLDTSTTRTDGGRDKGIVDMGYHYPKESIADLYYDGFIDINDLLIMAQQWLDVPGEPSADIAPEVLDNFVDYQDFAVIYQNWLW